MNAAVSPDLALTDTLVALGRRLQAAGYAFTTVTPATQARVNGRPQAQLARGLRDVFGWSRPFAAGLLPDGLVEAMRSARLVADGPGGLLRSRVRFSSLLGDLYAHSGYPTSDGDSVFFGPDTVRFADLVLAELQRQPLRASPRILDVGCGGGPGGIVAARACPGLQPRLVLADINPKALRFAAANAALAGMPHVAFAQGDLFAPVQGLFDLVVSNPPYLNDTAGRTYRHGGGAFGEGLSGRIVREGLPRLAPGGRLVLYTGAAIVDGRDPLLEALRPTLDLRGWPWHYRELDPDVFGEELLEPAYAGVERIAAVALVVQRPA